MSDIKLNAQGLSRSDKDFMSCIEFDEGYIGGSADLSSGEPTCTAHYSGDPNYIAANFGMVGKKPYYSDAGILMISDMYLMGSSVSPLGREEMEDLFHSKFGGVSFSDQWLLDSEVIKSKAKATRAFHKNLILALNYGQKPRGMVKNAYDKGYSLKFKDAEKFYNQFWFTLFPGVRKLGERLEHQFLNDGCLINEFGFRLLPDGERLCLNYFIQSTVSGIMNALNAKFFGACEWADFITIIHDETLMQVPEDRVEEAKEMWQKAVDSLNEDLGWTVKIRSGFVAGRDWYECK